MEDASKQEGGKTLYQQILYTVEHTIAVIALNRPEAGNALTALMQDEIIAAFERAGCDEAVRAVLITGKGRHFCAGGDIKGFRMMLDRGEYLEEPLIIRSGCMTRAMHACPKPVVAMVNGAATGAGCSIALGADFRVMSPGSSLIMAFSNMGLCGDTGGYFHLSRLIGAGRAAQIMAMGEPVKGERAFAWGLANELAESDEGLQAAAFEFAGKLAARPTTAIAYQKKLANEFFYQELEQFTHKEAQYMRQCSMSEDFNEAVNAFLERRAPQFSGR